MKAPPTNICPLLAIANPSTGAPATCLYDRCAFWDHGGSECAVVTAAIAIREAAENLETLAEKSQTSGNLDKLAAAPPTILGL